MFKKYITVLSAAFLMLSSSNSFATDLSYTYLEITDKSSRSDDVDASLLQHALSFEVRDNFFVAGNFTHGDYDVTSFELTVGEHSSINESTDLVSSVSYSWMRYEYLAESENLQAFEFSVGLRSMVADKFELNAGAAYADFSSRSPSQYLYFGAAFYATEALSLRLNYITDEPLLSASESLESNSISFSLRLDM